MNFLVRKIHKYLSFFISLQLLLWTISGIYFAFNKIELVRGEQYLNHVETSFDLSKLKMDANATTKKVVLTHFPQPEVLSIETNINYYDKKDGMFNKFEASDLTELHANAKAHIQEKIPESGLFNVARGEALEAIQLIESIVETIGWKLDYSALMIENQKLIDEK